MAKIDGNSVMEYINTNIKRYQNRLPNINAKEQFSNMADQYTSAIYSAREAMNKRMTGPVLIGIKNYGIEAYQMVRISYG